MPSSFVLIENFRHKALVRFIEADVDVIVHLTFEVKSCQGDRHYS